MRGTILRAIPVVAAAIAAPSHAVARTQEVRVVATAAQLLELADRLERARQLSKVGIILAALAADPNADIRNEARFRQAKLLAADGQTSRAALLLRQILDERPGATPVRLELAQLLDKMGDKEGAWRQMRAIHASGLPPAVARLIDRYSQALRAQRPFGASFEIALAPDTNINRATRSDTLGTVIGDFEIAPDARAKSGTGLSVNAQAYRRLGLGNNLALLARVTAFANLYRQQAFNDIAADVAIGPEFNLGRDRLQAEIGATQRWFGQKPFLRSGRIAATFSHPLSGRTLLRLSGSAALIDNQRNNLQDGRTYSGQVAIEHALTATLGLTGSVALDRQNARDGAYSTTGWRSAIGLWRDLGRITLTAGVELGRLHADDRLALLPNRREDRFSRLSLGATFRQLQFQGFAPVLRFSIERNRSSVEFYDYRRTRTEMGIVRAF